MRRWAMGASLLAAGLASLVGCSGDGGGGGGTTTAVDTTYNFTAAGVQPGVNTRAAGRGTITGLLQNSALAPVAGVTVTLYRLVITASRQNVGSITTTSGADGRYVFGEVTPGQYRVKVQTQTADCTVAADTDTTCNFSNVTGGGGGTLPDARYKWTMIIFMNADNDLEPYAVQDINEMEALPASDDVAIVVLMDRTRGFDTSNNNWTDTRRFKIQHDTDPNVMTSAKSPAEGGTAEVLGELDTGDKDTVQSFITWAMTNYPANHYLLDVWNHGAGWRKRASGTRGVLFDDTSNTWVTTPELSEALAAPAPIDIVAFDSSLMQMLEVAYQIRGLCSYVVGSEESPPGEGYPYDQIFNLAVSTPTVAPETLAAHIVNATVDALGTQNELTQSALRAAQLGNLAAAVSGFADVLRAKDATFHAQIAAARTAAQRYGSSSSLYEGNRDLLDFCDQVVTRTADAELASARDGVRDALQAALVAERHSGTALANSHGLALFIPSRTDWTDLRNSYRQTAFATDGRWDEWIDLFHGVN